MMRARPYIAGDARLVRVQAEQTIEARGSVGLEADAAAKAGPSYTILNADRVVAVGGLVPLWRGFATAWAFAEELDARTGAFVRGQIRTAINELGFVRRIEATARADFPRAMGFLMALGFDPVALLKSYGADGADYWLYAWLKETRS